MGKNRKSKRQLVRDEKRAKKRERETVDDESRDAKRQRHTDEDAYDATADFIPLDDDNTTGFVIDTVGTKAHKGRNEEQLPKIRDEEHYDDDQPQSHVGGHFEREFFGMLEEEEQEYFRHADELLELNDFPSPEERHMFLQNVYREAQGKELKLASSQSCSRLMERLILLSNTKQKKRLFEAFGGHFISLVTHRFASHCCEKLFLQSAPVVTQELSGDVEMAEPEEGEEEEEITEAMKMSMEELLLLTLDEFEEHLSFLLSDRYGSHALRVLLLVLSGRPLEQAGVKSLLQGKGKEYITVEGAAANASELSKQTRTVPSSFTGAVQKIIQDSIAGIDATALRVLAKHPTGNPTLQLLLDLELESAPKGKKKAKKGEEEPAEEATPDTLLEKLVPGAPASFTDEQSPACQFVNSMVYDPIGSRLLETLITHCPGKIFKGLHANIFGPRIASFLRNDIASYPAIRVLNRLSKEDLADAVEKSLPELGSFLEKGRLNVIKTLFERCGVRGATAELNTLLQALTTACGGNYKLIVPRLCLLDEPATEDEEKKKFQGPEAKNKSALLSHGCQLVSALLAIPGNPSKAIQTSLLAIGADKLVHLSTSSAQTAGIITKSLASPPQVPHFHKLLVAQLLPNIVDIALTQHGNPVVCAIIACPSKGEGSVPVVPFHLKENVVTKLEQREAELRQSWLGRNVWRTWQGDKWSHRRHDWVRWAKEANPEEFRVAVAPKVKDETLEKITAAATEDRKRKREVDEEEKGEEVNGEEANGEAEVPVKEKKAKKSKKDKKDKSEKSDYKKEKRERKERAAEKKKKLLEAGGEDKMEVDEE